MAQETFFFRYLYTQILGHFSPLQLSNIVMATAVGAEFKGAMDDANSKYSCQTCLPCPGSLNVILCPCLLSGYKHKPT